MALCRRRLGMCSKMDLGEVAAPRAWVIQTESNLMSAKAVELRFIPSSSQERLGENETRVPGSLVPRQPKPCLLSAVRTRRVGPPPPKSLGG